MSAQHALEEEVFTGRLDMGLWRKILPFSLPYRRQMVLLGVTAVIVAGCDVAIPVFTGWIVDEITRNGAQARIGGYLAGYAGSFLLLAACILAFILLAGRITCGVSHDIRSATFQKLQHLPFSYFDRKAVGWLMARLTGDCGNLSRVMGWALLDIVWGTCFLVMMTAAMFWLNWKLALVVLLVAPALYWVSRFFQVRLLLTSRQTRKANSIVTGAFNEGIVGVKTTKSMSREDANLSDFSVLTGNMYRFSTANALYSAMFIPLVSSICAAGVGLALWRGGVEVLSGTMTLGTLVMFVHFASRIVDPAQELANTLTMIQGAQASAERVASVLDAPLEIEDTPEAAAFGARHPRPSGPIRSIEFRDVSFAYRDGPVVLRNFNLRVEQGQTIALVGPTGGGKTTIVSLLCRFYEPTSGSILIDGVDYRQRPLAWLHSGLGMVLQQPHLFSGTIRENIRYGNLGAKDEQIEHAAKLTNADAFIQRLPAGYETQVGEGGNQLSTGQKQLIALARAVVANPRLFVMDEATSSVDTRTEHAIQEAVERVLEGRISFVIAHRLSTIRSADRILVISGGEVVEQGTHHDLLARKGHYYELYTSQFVAEHEEQLVHSDDAPDSERGN